MSTCDDAGLDLERGVERLTQDHRTVLRRFLPRRSEDARAAAYELGRSAFTLGVPLLDVCRLHEQVTVEVLRDAPADELLGIHEAAAELLLEVLAAYDMTHRGALER